MKNIVLALVSAVLVSACSSGTTVSEVPSNVTSRFVGTFQNTPGTQSGNVTLDILENSSGLISGNIIFTSSGANCLSTGTVSGSTTGFNVSLTAGQSAERFQTVTRVVQVETITEPDGSETSTTLSDTSSTTTSSSGSEGTTTTTSTSGNITTTTTSTTTKTATTGTLSMQFTSSNGGSTLSGTYTVSGETCSNDTGSGTMTLSR